MRLAVSELILATVYAGDIPIVSPAVSVEDPTAVAILSDFQPAVLRDYSPRATYGDGNCCYRAVSQGMYGHQEEHLHVRLLAATEMIIHAEHYDVNSPSYVGLLNPTEVFVDTYAALVDSVTTDGSYAQLMHILAISAALRVGVTSYMAPCVRLTSSPYNSDFHGRGVRRTVPPSITLMWSMILRSDPGVYNPDHFVLLMRRSDMTPDTVSVSDTDDDNIDIDAGFQPDVVDNRTGNDSGEASVVCQSSDDDITNSDDDDGGNARPSSAASNNSDTSGVDTVAGATESADGVARLPGDDWLSTDDIVTLLRQPPPNIRHQSVPVGRKDNCYCVVDNTANVERHGRGQRRQYDDDCGSWNASGGRLCAFPYIVSSSGGLRRVFLRGGVYCTERKVDGCRTYVAIDPQPTADSVITVTRYYGTSNADAMFKKRVSWLDDESGPSAVAVVEYKGIQPDATVHGNAKRTDRPYIRTPAATMDKVAAAVTNAPPKSVYVECLQQMSPTTAPRNSRSVRDKKYNDMQKARRANQTVHRLNFADEILQVSGNNAI